MKILRALHQKLIAPELPDENLRSREIVLNWILFSLFCLTLAAWISSFVTLLFLNEDGHIGDRLVSISVWLGLIALSYYLVRRKQMHRLVSTILLLMLFAAATMVVSLWGILTPMGVLLFSLTVVMAGILLGARFSLYLAVLTLGVLSFLEYTKAHGIIHPDTSWMKKPSNPSDVVTFSTIYVILGLTCWLFNRQMERSLRRATRAEAALLRQNERLEEKVLARTQELENEQLEKMQQMYRFAELGHVSTALFHDLANHLSTVSLDIENLQKKTQPEILSRIDDNIHYIDTIVQRVRSQLQGKVKIEIFDIKEEIREVARVSAYGAEVQKVAIDLDLGNNKPLPYKGDVLRFRQIVVNLLSNGIEAHKGSKRPKAERQVNVRLRTDRHKITIEVTDHGTGIPPATQERIFDPFYTSKEKGVGIGLFIVKQVTERDFKGDIKLAATGPDGTTFAIELPRKRV